MARYIEVFRWVDALNRCWRSTSTASGLTERLETVVRKVVENGGSPD